MTALRAATIELMPLVRGFTLRAIHRQLYQDILSWAGRLREVDIYQGDTPFCHFAYRKRGRYALMQNLEKKVIWLAWRKRSSSSGSRASVVKSTCCIPSGWKWSGTADLLRATGDHYRVYN